MKVLLFGATGMVGQGVLRACLAAPDVTEVLAVGRTRLSQSHARLRQLLRPDLAHLAPDRDLLTGFDACFFCLGQSSAGMSEADYTRSTYELTLAVARLLAPLNPGMSFVYVSGAGTDSTERGRSMWARVKGRTENDLQHLGFAKVVLFRPGIIQPLHGIQSKTASYRVLYALLGPLLSVARRVFPNHVATTESIGRAMLQSVRARVGGVMETTDIARLAEARSGR